MFATRFVDSNIDEGYAEDQTVLHAARVNDAFIFATWLI